MKRFHITITDNKTSEVLADVDTGVIVAAIDVGENTQGLDLCESTNRNHVAALLTASQLAVEAAQEDPDVAELMNRVLAREN